MPPDDENDDREVPSEPPTQPDLAVFPCPACQDERGRPTGARLHTVLSETGHRSRLRRCPICKGKKQLNREQLVAYKARPPEDR